MEIFELQKGSSPLIISIPHAGTYVPDKIKAGLNDNAMSLPDTDWHVDRLYAFAVAMGATVIKANYSRYVIDLNRSPDDTDLYPGQVKMPLCPIETFNGSPLYKEGRAEPDQQETSYRCKSYWQPYHDALAAEIARIKECHGFAILYDAHSIRSTVPRLFEGKLPDLNLGTVYDKSCALELAGKVFTQASKASYSAILNGRFIGGYITRHYGDPKNHVHALQMELSQCNYMNESPPYNYDTTRAAKLIPVLEGVLQSVLDWAEKEYETNRA